MTGSLTRGHLCCEPDGRGLPPARLLLAALLLSAWGCGEPPHSAGSLPTAGVSVDGVRRHAPLLLSEILEAADPQELLDSRFTFANRGATEAAVRFDGAGCSCYEVTGPRGKLQRGELLAIPALGELSIRFGVATPTAAGEREYTARFTWLKSPTELVPLPLSLTIPAYDDLSTRPQVLSVGYRPGEPPSPIELVMERHSRQRDIAESEPWLEHVPELLSSGTWRRTGLEEIVPGLWRVEWTIQLTPRWPADFRGELRSSLQVASGLSADEVRKVPVSVLIQPRVGIRTPGPVQFGVLPRGTPRVRRVMLMAADQIPFRLTSVACTDPRVSITPSGDESAVRQWLTLELRLNDSDPLQGLVICQTDHPASPQIEFAVNGRAATAAESLPASNQTNTTDTGN